MSTARKAFYDCVIKYVREYGISTVDFDGVEKLSRGEYWIWRNRDMENALKKRGLQLTLTANPE